MQQLTYLHSRSSSPTMRPLSTDATITASDPEPYSGAGSSARSGARAVPSRFDDLPEIKKYSDGSTEFRRPGESFTTVVREVEHDAMPLVDAHTLLDCGYTSSLTVPVQMFNSLKKEFGSGPAMNAALRTSTALEQGTAGKTPLAAAIQTMVNSANLAKGLERDYRVFADDAKELLAASAAGHAVGSAAVSAPLQRILARVWPTMRFKSHAERSAWMERTMQDPKPFVAQSFDVLDLALGAIAVKFPTAKLFVKDSVQSIPDAEFHVISKQWADSVNAVGAAFKTFSDGSIPMDDQMLKGHSLVAWLKS